jgi:hypothetical protein
VTDTHRIAFAWQCFEHERSVSVCAFRLARLARRLPAAPERISDFVADALSVAPKYVVPSDWTSLARFCAKRITQLAAARRMSVAELLERERVVDDLASFRGR